MKHLAAIERQLVLSKQTHDFAQVCRFLLAGKGSTAEAAQLAELERRPHVAAILKAAADPVSLSSLADFRLIAAGFAAALQNVGLFDALLAGGMKRIPLGTGQVGAVTDAAIAAIVGEGGVKPISRLTIAGGQVTPSKAAGILVLSNELLRFSAESESLIRNELLNAAALAADIRFLQIATAGITPFTSSGSTALAFLNDLSNMLAAIRIDQQSRLFLAMPSLVASMLATKGATSTDASEPFPELGPQGGAIRKIPVIVSDACAVGTVSLLDASGFAGASGQIELDRFQHATLQLDTAPDSPPTGATNIISLWQNNLSALRAERFIAAQRLRANAVASVVNSNSWVGGFSPA